MPDNNWLEVLLVDVQRMLNNILLEKLSTDRNGELIHFITTAIVRNSKHGTWVNMEYGSVESEEDDKLRARCVVELVESCCQQ